VSVRFILGKPGGGKTLSAVRVILRELDKEKGQRIATNLPLRLGYIAAYLKGKGLPAERLERLEILADEQVKAFYLHAQGRKATTDRTENLQIVERGEPTLFVLDEVHIFWPSRDYRQTGATLLSYLSQHRHLGDEVWLVTQHPGQTDKALHRLTEEYIVSINLSKRRMWGFRGPVGKFMLRTYFEIPNSLSKPAEVVTYTLKPEEADCYDTSVGVGVTAGLSDKGKTSKGLSPKYAMGAGMLGLCVLAVALYYGPPLISKALLWVSGGSAKKASEASGKLPTVLTTSSNNPAGSPFQFTQAAKLPTVIPAPGADSGEEDLLPTVTPKGKGMAFPNKLVERESGGVLANPGASAGRRVAYYIRGFDGRLHAVRVVSEPAEQTESIATGGAAISRPGE